VKAVMPPKRAAYPLGSTWISSHRLGGLQHQSAYVGLSAQHGARDVVEALEAEPALLVGRAQLRRPLRHQGVGERDAVALGELEERRVAHRAREVQVQVRLGQGPDVADGVQENSFCSRVMPSTMSSSPSA
jgi:hypothetical protein